MSIKLSSILMTVVCLSVCLLFGAWTQQYELIISIVLVLAIGIPHGALDHELFRFLPQSFPNLHNQAIFFVAYIGLMFTYLGLWLVAPLAALIGFLEIGRASCRERV